MPPRRPAHELSDLATWDSDAEPTAGAPTGEPRAADTGEGAGEGGRDLGHGRYEILEEIARGGMGRVVAATDRTLGRVVAVKEALTTDPDTVRRFARETEITARLEHPAIVPVYDAGFDAAGMPYYVMRKVSGQPLERLVDATRTLSERLRLLPHVVTAAQAMAHAHRRAVLHRDLKPSNILVGEFGETVVIDWGLAKVTDQADPDLSGVDPLPSSGQHVLTHAGSVFGTPGFMSPEQIMGKVVDARGDVYALGATLYFLLAKQAPHRAESGKRMMALAAAGPPTPIAQLVPGVPRDLAWIVDTALAFRPEDRYPHAGALAAELKEFLAGQLVASRHYTAREKLVRFVRRHRIAVASACAALVALGVAGSRVAVERSHTRAALALALREKQQADEALVEMRLSQARALLGSNPTAAIAVARPLADGPRWREVRAIGAAARYAGACFGLPGPLRPSMIELSGAGGAAISTDEDGAVWYLDLGRRTSRVVAQLPPRDAHAVFAGDSLVVYSSQRLARIDLASGAVRELPRSFEVRHAAATPHAVYAVTDTGRVMRVPLGSGEPVDVGVAGANRVVISPDLRRLAVETEAEGVVVLDTAGAAPPLRFGEGRAFDVRWDASSEAFSMHILGREIALVSLAGTPGITERHPTHPSASHLSMRGRLVSLTSDGLVGYGTGPLIKAAAWTDFPLRQARGDTLVVARRTGLVTLLHDHVGVELRAPSDHLARLAASPTSRYVVAATQGRVLVWNTDDILPAVRTVAQSQQYYAVGGRRLLLGAVFQPWRWHDLESGAEDLFELPFGPYQAVHDGSGERVVLARGRSFSEPSRELFEPSRRLPGGVDSGERGFVYVRRGRPARRIDLETSTIRLLGGRLLLGMPGGELLELEPETGARSVLVARPGHAVIASGAHGAWRSARWADGTVWRRRPDGREAWGRLPTAVSALPVLLQQADGRVCGAGGARLECWDAGGATALVAELPAEITWMDLVVGGYALAALADHGLYRIDLASGEVLGIGAGAVPDIAQDVGLAASSGADGRVQVTDYLANVAWPLVTSVRGGSMTARITPDGELVTLLANKEHLLMWRLALPATPAATAQWLDTLTNATVEHGTTKVGWR